MNVLDQSIAPRGSAMSSLSGHKLYPTLLSPMRVGAHTLRNRVVMGSMHTRLEHESEPDKRQRAFYGARAKGGAALIITGGFSPNEAGRLEPGGPTMMAGDDLAPHQSVVTEVQKHGAKILMQVLHSGRYAKHDNIVGVSAIRSPINPRIPKPMTGEEIEATIDDFVSSAALAARAGYDGVEIMGSEGYLINQFTAPRTNDREDRWGGSAENRNRFSVEIVRRIRERLGPHFLIMYRISAIDLVEGGTTADEIDQLALAVQAAGPTSSTPALDGTRRRFRPSLSACRGRRSASLSAACARWCRSRSWHRTGSTCPTSPRSCSPTAPAISSRWRGRCWPIPISC